MCHLMLALIEYIAHASGESCIGRQLSVALMMMRII
jgi:hypothetical protein